MLNTTLPTSIIQLNIFEMCASFPFNQTGPQQRVAGYRYFIYFGVFMCSGNIFYLRCNYITVIIGKYREAAAILTNMAIQHFHEISLSLNSNNLNLFQYPLNMTTWMKGRFQLIHITIFALYKMAKHLLFGKWLFW